MSSDMQEISRSDSEPRLVELLGEGKVKRVPLGDDALWLKA
jgi:hypothetical protein